MELVLFANEQESPKDRIVGQQKTNINCLKDNLAICVRFHIIAEVRLFRAY